MNSPSDAVANPTPAAHSPYGPARGLARLRRWAGLLANLLLVAYFVIGSGILVMRHAVLPNIDRYRSDIAQVLSKQLGLPVTIDKLSGDWWGLHPHLRIEGLAIADTEQRPALSFEAVDLEPAWDSLWHAEWRLASLAIQAPKLDIRRDAQGQLHVAGLALGPAGSAPAIPPWLLQPHRWMIRDASVVWHDEYRAAPPLQLSHLNIEWRNRGHHHRFAIHATPPAELASPLDVRGDWFSDAQFGLQKAHGSLYVDASSGRLANWQPWVDWPWQLAAASADLRLWLDFAHLAPTAVTADMRVDTLSLRLAPTLPVLDMPSLHGRLSVQHSADGWNISGRQWEYSLNSGLSNSLSNGPSTFAMHWQPATASEAARGRVSADRLNITALRGLAKHLPLPPDWQNQLDVYQPVGELSDMQAAWQGNQEAWGKVEAQIKFAGLGWQAHGQLPGAAGLNGQIGLAPEGGHLTLSGQNAALHLPEVFSEATLPLNKLAAAVDWRMNGPEINVDLKQAVFENADAAGEASGQFQTRNGSPGVIDLTARLSRANGHAVWRYMPRVVHRDVQHWLRGAILAGSATATLRLKGDLQHFPFRDGSGVFEIKAPIQGAGLRYHPDWPALADIAGELEFIGAGMRVRARHGKLWDLQLSNAEAEIPDLEKPLLRITGQAHGPSSDFLKFVDNSPVKQVVQPVGALPTATGNAQLQIQLDLPLMHLADSQVAGRWQINNNQIQFAADKPPLDNVQGDLHFTLDTLQARQVSASLLGSPVTFDIDTREHGVLISANGQMAVSQLRQHFDHPIWEHLSGASPWQGQIRLSKSDFEAKLTSTLEGISSSLPAPFNKSAHDRLPVQFERHSWSETSAHGSSVARELRKAALGEVLQLQLAGKPQDGQFHADQGIVVLSDPTYAAPLRAPPAATKARDSKAADQAVHGGPSGRADAKMPDQGVHLDISLPEVNVDFWRQLLSPADKQGNGGGELPFQKVALRTDRLTMLGRQLTAVALKFTNSQGSWQGELHSQETAGQIEWHSQGAGRIKASLAHLTLPDSQDNNRPDASSATLNDPDATMPAISVTVEHLLRRGHDLGQLRLMAENSAGIWHTIFQNISSDGMIEGKGRWQAAKPGHSSETGLEFQLGSPSFDKLLTRFGYGGAVKRGKANVSGQLYWAGAPGDFDYNSLTGQVALDLSNGQFGKIDPGVGRLLGVLSLQSLPRRVNLDFRDVFSEGFAFDQLKGNFTVSRGVASTEDLHLQGPAAKVLMNGKIDLVKETQDLKVRIQPAISETVATGVLLAHPAIGAATWAMNKIFGNPLDQAFAFDFAVTGSWTEPNVENLGIQPPKLELGGEKK